MPTADKWAHLYDNYDIDTIDADVAASDLISAAVDIYTQRNGT